MKIPKHILVNTGKQQGAYEEIERFFCSVKEEIIRREKGVQGPYFEIGVRGLHLLLPEIIPTDDFLHFLLYKDRVVAAVTEIRTEGNYISFVFFRNLENLLNPNT